MLFIVLTIIIYITLGTVFDRLCNVVVGYDVKIGSDCFLSHGVKIISAIIQDNVLVGANAAIIGRNAGLMYHVTLLTR